MTDKPTREEINALRLKAFASNDRDDRMDYYKACSGWFQDEDYREMERATALTDLLAERDSIGRMYATVSEENARVQAQLSAMTLSRDSYKDATDELTQELADAKVRAAGVEGAAKFLLWAHDNKSMDVSNCTEAWETLRAALPEDAREEN